MVDRFSVSVWIGPALVIAPLTLAASAAWATQPARLEPGVHQLFLDDVMVAERSNVISTMHPARKFEGNPVLMPEPGVETYALLYGTFLYDEEVELFKAWYATGRVGSKMCWCLGYATSTDGIHWEKPDLDVVAGLSSPANVVVTHPLIENYGVPDFICHFHFLRDIGKDFLGTEYDTIRKRLSKHGISAQLRYRAKQLKADLDRHPELIEVLQSGIENALLPAEARQFMPVLNVYALIQWTLRGKSEGHGYGFPFDRPHLAFAKRIHHLHSEVEKFKTIQLRGERKDY